MGFLFALLLIGVAILFGIGDYCSPDALVVVVAILIAGGLASND